MIRHINDVLDMNFNEYSRRFPAFFYTDANGNKVKPMLIPATAIANDRNCPMYFRRLIDTVSLDGDPYYLLFKANPLMGDASREKAVEFLDDLFYEKFKTGSSLDRASGYRPTAEYPLNGTMTREQAVNAEVLPAADDRQYQEFYDEQMDLVDAQAEDDEFEQKHGFRRNDPSIIDIAEPAAPASSTAVGAAASTAVGMPKAIWYGADLHIPSSGTRLGYDRGSHNLYGVFHRPRRSLREAEGAAKNRILKLAEAGELKWEDVAKAFVEKASEQQARDVAAESGWFQMDEGEMNEKHVEGIDDVIKALGDVKKLSESLDESVDFNSVSIISQGLRAIESAILRLQKTISGNASVSETEEFDPQNLDEELAEAVKASDEIDSKESDPLDESVSADVSEWNRILGSIR